MTTQGGFFGVLARVPLAAKKALDGLGRRKSNHPLFDEAGHQIGRGLGPVRQEIADELDEAEAAGDNSRIDMRDLTKIDAVRFYDKKGSTIVIAASFVPSQMYRAGSTDEPMGSVKTDRFLEPPPPRRFTIMRYELLDKNGKTLLGPAPVANPRAVAAGDAVDVALENF